MRPIAFSRNEPLKMATKLMISDETAQERKEKASQQDHGKGGISTECRHE